ncbi:MAG: hypothetical protein IIC70_05685 [Acidobacteria bacterium]|nr:hypothetical protein [Acidobacteriota bacterium]
MRVTNDLARAIAEEMLDQTVRTEIADIVINKTLETDSCWVFFYNTRAYIETGSMSHALAGNAPVFVLKDDPSAWFGRTDIPLEDQLP